MSVEVYKKSLKYIMNIESKKDKIADILLFISQEHPEVFVEAYETMESISVENYDDKIVEVFKGILDCDGNPTCDLSPPKTNIISAIKYYRSVSGLGLRESKEYVENLLAARGIK